MTVKKKKWEERKDEKISNYYCRVKTSILPNKNQTKKTLKKRGIDTILHLTGGKII